MDWVKDMLDSKLVSKIMSKRVAVVGASGYAIYALAVAGTLNPLSGGLLAGLALVYVAGETFRPSGKK